MKLLPLAMILIIIFALYYVKFIRTKKEQTETFNNKKIDEDRIEFALKDFRDYDSIVNPKIKGTSKITSFFGLTQKKDKTQKTQETQETQENQEGYSNLSLTNTDSGSVKKKVI